MGDQLDDGLPSRVNELSAESSVFWPLAPNLHQDRFELDHRVAGPERNLPCLQEERPSTPGVERLVTFGILRQAVVKLVVVALVGAIDVGGRR